MMGIDMYFACKKCKKYGPFIMKHVRQCGEEAITIIQKKDDVMPEGYEDYEYERDR